MRGELITGQQLYHSPQSALTNYFNMISKTQLFLWDIQLSLVLANPKLFGALCCCRKALLCSNPREKGSKQGWWYPSSCHQTFQTSKIYTKSCPWKLRWVFLLTELVFPSLWQIPSSPFAQQERICPWKGLPWGVMLDFVDISTGKQHVAENGSKLPKWLWLGLLYMRRNYLIGGIT